MKSLKNLIPFIILTLVILRVIFDEQYVLLVSGVYGNTILHKEICIDDFYDREQLLVVFYESNNKEKIGMVSVKKNQVFIFDCYSFFQKFEVNCKEKTYQYKISGMKNMFQNNSYPYESENIIFDDFYRTYPNGWQNQGELRSIYCGKISEHNKLDILKRVTDSEIKFGETEGTNYYFLVDTSEKLTD